MSYRIQCLKCPMCDQPPTFALSAQQVFCGNDDCPTFCWDATMTMAENRRSMTVTDLDRRDGA